MSSRSRRPIVPSSDSEEDSSAAAAAPPSPAAKSPSAAGGPNPLELEDEENTLRILLSTDHHLGYAERDPVRGMDSFAAFEETLRTAKNFNCDCVVMAGDLFHDNRPSRPTLHRTMDILRRYCMGPDPVRIKFLSDPASNFHSGRQANYQDPNYSVDLPVFSIHGNHDDPSRETCGSFLAALDLLAVSNLVNYWGRQEEVDNVRVSPVLLQKGFTRLALYGLGSLREERLHRMWERNRVRFDRPAEDVPDENGGDDDDDEEKQGFFNMFVLHQNRDLGRGSKNAVQESMIPEWMDLVVWGHEHECLIELFESVVGTFRITQPGSSVATSLVAGEAARKKVGILDIRGKQFRLHPVPLTQVRSFVTTEISLKQKAELDPDDPKIDSKVTAVLEEEVALMIMNAREKRTELIQDARDSFNSIKEEDLKYRLQKPNEVLVRIRVDHQGFTTLNNQRFGAKFVGEVANPTDILLFHRKKDPKLASAVSKKKMEPVAPDEMRQTNFEDVVKEELKVKDDKMKILTVKEMERAMEDYVDKNMPRSIPDVANNSLDRKVKMLVRSGKEKIENPSQIEECLAEGVSLAEDQEEEGDQASQKSARSKTNKTKKRSSEAEEESVSQSSGKGRSRKKSFEDSDDEVSQNKGKENSFESDEEENKTTARASKKRAPAKRSAPKQDTARKAARRQKLLEWSDEEEEDDDMMDVEPIKPKARPNRASSSREKPSYKDDSDDNWGDDDSDAIEVDDDEDDVLVIDEEEPKKTKRKTKKASKSTGKASAKRTTKKRQYFDDSSDEDYGRRRGSQKDLDDDWGTAATGTSGRM